MFEALIHVDVRTSSSAILIRAIGGSTVFALAQAAKSANHGRKSDQGGQGNEHRFEGQHVKEIERESRKRLSFLSDRIESERIEPSWRVKGLYITCENERRGREGEGKEEADFCSKQSKVAIP